MIAFIALFFPAALMVIWKRKLFDEGYDWKMMAPEYVVSVLLLNFIVLGIACFIFGNTGSVVNNLNTYASFALKYISLSLIFALIIPWTYLKTNKFQKIYLRIKHGIDSEKEEDISGQKLISPKIPTISNNGDSDAIRLNFSRCFFVASFVFFVFMMLFNLTHSAPWGDEWVEYNYSRQSILDGSLYQAVISTYQPPLYNFLMHFWLLLGTSVLWFRLFNVVCGMISGMFLHKTVSRLVNPNVASFTLCILGATYHWVYCIQECSEYALMLMFLFLAFYFYVCACEKDSVFCEIFFILSCTGAMYSQYGAFFIVVPLLVFHFVKKCLGKNKRSILRTVLFYAASLVIFAMPLYFFYAKIQIANNEIVENTSVVLSAENMREFPLVFGELIAYFLDLGDRTTINRILSFMGIVILLSGIVILFKKNTSFAKKSLIGVMLSGYTLFYWFVVFHIYAMVHANESSGFYSRYAYFLIPIMVVAIPLTVDELLKFTKNYLFRKSASLIFAFVISFITFIGYPSLLNNWNKAYDDKFAEIWFYNEGFNETTFLFGGVVSTPFIYYTSRYSFEGDGEVLYASDMDLDDLPSSFWAWSTNWDTADSWQTLIDSATDQGYTVVIYYNRSSAQLAYCALEDT